MAHMTLQDPDAPIERAVKEAVRTTGYAPGSAAPNEPDVLLTRRDAAAALRAAGFPVAEKTLATKATRGGGPPYQAFGPRVLYRWGDALAWAQGRMTPPRRSTSEADALRHDAGQRRRNPPLPCVGA